MPSVFLLFWKALYKLTLSPPFFSPLIRIIPSSRLPSSSHLHHVLHTHDLPHPLFYPLFPLSASSILLSLSSYSSHAPLCRFFFFSFFIPPLFLTDGTHTASTSRPFFASFLEWSHQPADQTHPLVMNSPKKEAP